ncbi:zinc finger protein 502-like isoform X2 [Haliotis rubra]|uniref:zinc finger protein 502-like isoform X2 n=1 Tax=Haliotis rubra TaxID=36100 RepID=UPI001EE51747|nr:zinc finger protein 502-like isoform X2 [Haliotis rubra]
MGPKRKRHAYDASFKLRAVARAEATNNCAAAREFEIDERQVRNWRKEKASLMEMPKNKQSRRFTLSPFIQLEDILAEWVLDKRQHGLTVTRSMIRLRALTEYKAKKDEFSLPSSFQASSTWCTRFMNRMKLALRDKTHTAQKIPEQVKQEPCEETQSRPECEMPQNNYMDVEVPGDDRLLYCEDCSKEYEGDCTVHGPLLIVADTQEMSENEDRAWKTMPVGLEIEESGIPGAGLGVWASQDLIPRICFGPYEGDTIKDEATAQRSGYSWQIHTDGQPSHFVDGHNCSTANWMRYVNCARTEEEQNLTAFQYRGHIYYRVYKEIGVGTELLVWYGHKYAKNLGIKRQLKLPEGHTEDMYPCDTCDLGFSSVVLLWKHLEKMHGGRLTAQLRFIVNTQGVNIHEFIEEMEKQKQETHAKGIYSPDIVVKSEPEEEDYNSDMNEDRNTGCEEASTETNNPKKQKSDAEGINSSDIVVKTEPEEEDNNSDMNEDRNTGCEEALTETNSPKKNKQKSYAKGINSPDIVVQTEIPKEGSNSVLNGDRNTGCEAAPGGTNNAQKHKQPQEISDFQCQGELNSGSKPKTHMTCQRRSKPFPCNECRKTFMKSHDLETHMKLHGVKPYKCTECEKTFAQAKYLQKHMKYHTGVRSHMCSECGKAFVEASELQRHMICHTGVRQFRCSECGKTFRQSGSLHIHMRSHSGIKPYKCSECGMAFVVSGSLKQHMRCHTGVKPYQCGQCGKAFAKSGNLQAHMRSHSNIKAYKCSECGKAFVGSSNLHKHMRRHTGVKAYKCGECGKSFTESCSLKQHMIRHTGVKLCKCPECGKSFTQSLDLKLHMRCHNDKPYKCGECGKAFTGSCDLKQHMRCHSGDKPYKCEECGKAFTQSGNLKMHLRCHSGVKPYKCDECGKEFTQSSNLKIHLRCHSGVKPFKCNECGKEFTRAGTLKKHLRCHSGSKPDQCC